MSQNWEMEGHDNFETEREELVRVTRALQKDEFLGFLPGALTSIKSQERNLLGEKEVVLHILHGYPHHPISLEDFTALRANALAGLEQLKTISDEELENAIACSRKRADTRVPPRAALTHAVLPYVCILTAQPLAVLAIACTPEGENRLREACGGTVLYLPYAAEGLSMAKACASAVSSAGAEKVEGLFMQGHGLIAFGASAREAFERMQKFTQQAGDYIQKHGGRVSPETASRVGRHETRLANNDSTRRADQPMGKTLAGLRDTISKAAGRPLILTLHAHPEYTEAKEIRPAIAAHVPYLRRQPIAGMEVATYVEDYRRAFIACGFESVMATLDLAPRVSLDPALGISTLGRTAQETGLAMKIFRHTASVAAGSEALGEYRSLPEADLLAYELSNRQDQGKDAPFTGEVALVTGGASGIGKACVESLLRRGAAVVSLDINPKVGSLYDRSDYLGLECDLTDETAIQNCFETFTRAFGGLDMLVLNAGVFPAGCRIESLTLEEWQRVMRINLDSNLVVLREAHPLLKQSPNGGRVLVNASKNVLAPGAGAAAYSASKAAVTQMARVAALEWGKDGIRVNMVHPDAVFDTGIWNEEVLQVRAAHYGLTVQQYKTRNVLGVELNSHYVAELVAEMLGERFEKITGAQIPVDGGSDRVI